MSHEIASAGVGVWRLTLDEIGNTNVSVLELCIDGENFDVSVNLPCISSLESLANAIESSENANVTAKERCFARWTVADLFIFVDEPRLTFLLLDTVGDKKRFRISVPVTQKQDFLTALYKLKEEAEAEL